MKRLLITILVCIILNLFSVPVFAEQADYRDARLFGKVITQDIAYGTLYYRDDFGNYITIANQTYIRVEPLYQRHQDHLNANIGKTVVLLGRMNTRYSFNTPMVTYHDVKPVDDFKIDLDKVYYFSNLRNINQSYGLGLSNESALADLLEYLNNASNLDFDLTKEHTGSTLINFKDNNLRYQWLLGEKSDIVQSIRNNLADINFIKGCQGKNILVQNVGPSWKNMYYFMDKEILGKKRKMTKQEGPMTIYGRLKSLYSDDEKPNYEITGAVGFTLEDWMENFKNGKGPVESWPMFPNHTVTNLGDYSLKDYVRSGEHVWLTGRRWQLKNENGDPLPIFYFRPYKLYTTDDIQSGLQKHFKLTDEELVI